MNFSRFTDRLSQVVRTEKANGPMDDRLEAFEVEPSYDREDDPFPRGPRVLWGRVAALGGALILAFLLGGQLAGGGGGNSSQVTALQRQLDDANSKISQLQSNLAALSSGQSAPTGLPSASPTTGASTTPTATAATAPVRGGATGSSVTYTVNVGDTLGGIASHFYGRATHAGVVLIEQANGLSDATIRVGMKLTIPPAPAGSTTPTSTATASPKSTSTPRATVSPRVSSSATP